MDLKMFQSYAAHRNSSQIHNDTGKLKLNVQKKTHHANINQSQAGLTMYQISQTSEQSVSGDGTDIT